MMLTPILYARRSSNPKVAFGFCAPQLVRPLTRYGWSRTGLIAEVLNDKVEVIHNDINMKLPEKAEAIVKGHVFPSLADGKVHYPIVNASFFRKLGDRQDVMICKLF